MGLFKYLDSITPKIYILSIGNEVTIAKIGYTKKEIEKRIKDYKFSGQWKGKESEIKIHAIFENPKAEANPYIKPFTDPIETLSNAIMTTPIDATNMAAQTPGLILSFKNKKPNKAVIKGIADKHNNVIAALVLIIDQINVIIAVPRPTPPIIPAIPIFK